MISLRPFTVVGEPAAGAVPVGRSSFKIPKVMNRIPGELLNWTLRNDLRAPFVPDCRRFKTVALINTMLRFERLFA